MAVNRRHLLKNLVAGSAFLPVLGGKLFAQGGAEIPGFDKASGPGPAGVWAFVNAAKAAVRTGPQAFAALFQDADGANVADQLFYSLPAWSETSPTMMIREKVEMITPGVAMVDAEIGRFHTVGGWEGAHVWIVIERRGQGAGEVWKPVLVRAYPMEVSVPVTIFGMPRQRLL